MQIGAVFAQATKGRLRAVACGSFGNIVYIVNKVIPFTLDLSPLPRLINQIQHIRPILAQLLQPSHGRS